MVSAFADSFSPRRSLLKSVAVRRHHNYSLFTIHYSSKTEAMVLAIKCLYQIKNGDNPEVITVFVYFTTILISFLGTAIDFTIVLPSTIGLIVSFSRAALIISS